MPRTSRLSRSEYQALYDLVLDKLARASLAPCYLSPAGEATVTRLVDDLASVCTDEPEWRDEPFEDVYDEWIRRIGGERNLPEYLKVLQAGDRRRAGVSR